MNDKREKTDSEVANFIITILIAISIVFVWFFKKAIEQRKLPEAITTFSILVVTYYLMYLQQVVTLWIWLVPIGIFSVLWTYLFSLEVEDEVTNPDPNPCWANRNWWWTLDGWSFEEEVAEIFRLNGYLVEVTKKTGDGGVDLILWKDDMKTIVQCKHFRAPIPVAYVRELNGVREDMRAHRVIMVASSGASPQCYEFIRNKPYFDILDLDDIIEMGLRPISHTP